jgi:arylformamidase
MQKVYDISIDLTPELPHWPGEKGFSIEKTHRGDVCVSEISMGLHCGTHLDAPYHFIPTGKKLDEIPLEDYLGAVRVVEIRDPERITRRELESLDLAGVTRIIFKTANSERWQKPTFDEQFIGLAADGAEYLVELGVRLIGTDYLSIEAFLGDGTVHNILLARDVVILEGLNLRETPAGDYFLVAVPLKMPGAEASPTRAFLFPRDYRFFG